MGRPTEIARVIGGAMRQQQCSQVSSARGQAVASWMRKQWPDGNSLLLRFTPDRQHRVMESKVEDVLLCPCPTLTDVRLTYGEGYSKAWLTVQLDNLNEFAGVTNRMEGRQIRELAYLIDAQHGSLKLSELMLFFVWLKSGRYGRFYGTVDPMSIMLSLERFCEERSVMLGRFRDEREKVRRLAALDEALRVKREEGGVKSEE